MQKYFKNIKFTAIVALAIIVVGCDIFDTERDPAVYDGEQLVKFSTTAQALFVEESDGGQIMNVTANVLKPASSDLTYSFEVVTGENGGTAQAGVHYQFPSTSFTVPRGETIVNIPIEVFFQALDNPVTLVLRMTSPGTASFGEMTTVRIQQFYPYVQSEFVGRYRVTYPWWEPQPYEIDVIAGPNANELIAVDMLLEGKDFTITMNDTDRSNFTASFLETNVWQHPAGGVRVQSTSGSFNAGTYTMNFTVTQDIPGVGSFPANQQMTLQRIGDL